MSIVVDASVLLALLIPHEPLVSQAFQLINQQWQAPVSAPHLMKSEVTASLRKAVSIVCAPPAYSGPTRQYRSFLLPTDWGSGGEEAIMVEKVREQAAHVHDD